MGYDPHNPRNWHWPEGMPESLANSKVRMAVKHLNIKHNADGTITIKADNYTESIEIEGKSGEELYDAVKWGIIGAGFQWTNAMAQLVRSELNK